MKKIWFWQKMISPHMANLAEELAKLGVEVHYIVSENMSIERASEGWIPPEIPSVYVHFVKNNNDIDTLMGSLLGDEIHICQGLRANGYISYAQKIIWEKGLKNFIIIETIDFSGWKGLIRNIVYKVIVGLRKNSINGVLAIGDKMPEILYNLGFDKKIIYPFAYFLDQAQLKEEFPSKINNSHNKFIFLYVGRMITLKRVDLFIKNLALLTDYDYEVWFVGDGDEINSLKELAVLNLENKERWLGQVPMSHVRSIMQQADCLVLPSIHDGWGAVLSESLIVGTPAICSSSCGGSIIVKASNVGGVFEKNNSSMFKNLLEIQLKNGKISNSKRSNIKNWAESLCAPTGAKYLKKILYDVKKPDPPWNS